MYIIANDTEVNSERGPNQVTIEDVDGSLGDDVNTGSRGAEHCHSENHQLRRRITQVAPCIAS